MRSSIPSLALLMLSLSTLCLSPASSEERAAQDSTAQVRVLREVDGEWLFGGLVAITADSVMVVRSPDGVEERFALHDVEVVEASEGFRPSGHRMMGGLFLGAIVGGLGWTAVASYNHHPSEFGDLYKVGAFTVGAAVGGIVGLVVGHSPVEMWKTLYISDAAARQRHEQSRWP